MFDVLFSEHTLTTALSLATPILLCALGGAVCSQSGNFNISMEAFMLVGAFFGVVGSYYLNSAAAGILTAVLASVAMALLYGFFLIKLKANEISQVLVSSEGDPLITVWTYGQGRAMAYAMDCAAHWAPAAMTQWDGYRLLWNNIAAWLTGLC